MNDVDKAVCNLIIDSFTSNWILLQYNNHYAYKKVTQDFTDKILMKFFINGLIEPLYNDSLSLADWQIGRLADWQIGRLAINKSWKIC
jgi:hypothetical protein